MSQFFSAVDCQEYHMSSSEGGDLNSGLRASVTLQVPWGDRWALMDDILSNSRSWPKAPPAVTVLPRAFSASCVPLPGGEYTEDGQGCNYSGDALVTVNYGTQITQTGAESIEPSMDYDTMDHRLLHWTSGTGDTLLESEAPPIVMRSLNITRTRYKLSAIPNEVLTCVGKVNSTTYTSAILGLSFNAETLLFQPGGIQRSFTDFGNSGFTLTMKFAFKPETWNKFRRATNGLYYPIYFKNGTQYKPFAPASFAALLD
jgi:hypothetical protein